MFNSWVHLFYMYYCLCFNYEREREVAQSCPTLYDPMDSSLPGPSVHGIFQARVLEYSLLEAFYHEPLAPSSLFNIFTQIINNSFFPWHLFLWPQGLLFPVGQTVKRLPTMRETQVQSLGQEDLLKKEMATHSSILVWKIPWMKEAGRL